MGGTVPNEGRVEVRVACNTAWGTVCDDQWDTLDAQVVCRQLGYLADGAIAYTNAYFGRGTGSILLDNLECNGTEANLLQCTHNGLGVENCGHNADAGVFCNFSEYHTLPGAYRGGFPGVSGNPFGFYTLLETLRNRNFRFPESEIYHGTGHILSLYLIVK